MVRIEKRRARITAIKRMEYGDSKTQATLTSINLKLNRITL